MTESSPSFEELVSVLNDDGRAGRVLGLRHVVVGPLAVFVFVMVGGLLLHEGVYRHAPDDSVVFAGRCASLQRSYPKRLSIVADGLPHAGSTRRAVVLKNLPVIRREVIKQFPSVTSVRVEARDGNVWQDVQTVYRVHDYQVVAMLTRPEDAPNMVWSFEGVPVRFTAPGCP